MKSLPCPLEVQIALRPNHPFIITSAKTISYLEFGQKVKYAEGYLHSLKVKPSSRIALWAEPSIDSIALLYAIWRKRAVACILNTRLPASVVIQQLKSLRCSYLCVENKPLPQWPSSKTIKIELSSRAQAGRSDLFINRLLRPSTSSGLRPEQTKCVEGLRRSKGAPRNDITKNKIALAFKEDQPTTILFTSGSSASPKAALLTWGNFYFNALGSNQNLTFAPNDKWLLSLPLYHVSGLGILFRALLSGGSIALNSKPSIENSINNFLVTHLSVVPTQLYQLLQNSKNIKLLQRLKAILIGGSAVPANLIQQSLKHKLPLYVTYGLTEMASQVATSSKIQSLQNCSKIKILPYRQIKIASNQEILVKGKTLFNGYVSTPKKKRTLTRDGWFRTGDLGKITQRKYLQVWGRKDRMFISGGENIQPEEIEKHLLNIPSVKQALVVGTPDPQFGARPLAFIEQSLSDRMTKKAIIQFLAQHLPKYKVPDQFFQWPRQNDSSIKINRQRLTVYLQENKHSLKPIL